jgi:molybdenum cofactor guanylyltransferase
MSVRVRPCASLSCGISILAGGLSSRMGKAKAGLRLGRRSLLGHVRRIAEGLGVRVRIIRKDLVPRCGPLGGIYTGLKTSMHEAEMFLSCDMPFVTAELLTKVMRAKAPIFVEYRGRVGFPLMLAAADVAVVENEIRAGRLSLQSLAKRLKAKRLRLGEREGRQLFNVNTPADWAEALKRRAELPL